MLFSKAKAYLFGQPLATKAISQERFSNSQGLAIFASDALSSTAYATEEILLVLVGGGAAALFYSIPIAIAIVALILIVSVSYRQVVHAYPQGGGVYNVARKNMGETPALIGASSLLIDYILTTAVSAAAGVAAITSVFPSLLYHRVLLGIAIIFFLMWINLRGVRASGKIFSTPTYIFIISFFAMIVYGVYRFVIGTFPVVTYESSAYLGAATQAIGLFFIVRAFAAGCTAMTGIEAISNGVRAFKPPESKNAAKTLVRMALILLFIFSGITLLAYWGGIIPMQGETVISQLARALFGRNFFYFLIQGATMLILVLAANTPFADFPRVASQLAKDDYFPRQFLNLGSRLVFANGIIVLAIISSFVIAFFGGDVHAIIPLYAVGVFLGFSITQLGMIFHWRNENGVKFHNILPNVIGFLATSVVFIIVFTSKFDHGAWMLIPAAIALILFMKAIKYHYLMMESQLAMDGAPIPDTLSEKTMVILIPRLNRATLYALKFAQSFKPAHLRAFHVAIDEEEGFKLKKDWEFYAPGVPIDVVYSEYRDLTGPVLDYLKNLSKKWQDDTITVVIPQVVPGRFWHHFLHNQTALRLRFDIEQDPEINVEILEVPIKATTKLRL